MTHNDHRFIVLIRNIFYEVYSNDIQNKSNLYKGLIHNIQFLFQNMCKLNAYTLVLLKTVPNIDRTSFIS